MLRFARSTGKCVARSFARRLGRIALLLACTCIPGVAALAATVTVTSTADTIAVDGGVTLREAIASVNGGANVNADVVAVGAYGVNDTIAFNIPGCATVCKITLTGGALGTLSKPATIDGYTQPGASANTLAVGDNAVLKIEIDGNQAVSGGGSLLFITGGNTTIRGLNMHNAGVGNINFTTGSNYVVEGNFFGTTPDGTAAATPGGNGTAVITTATNLRVGGTAPAQRNLMSGLTAAISVGQFANDTLIQGNYIGTDKTGTAAIGNILGIAAPTAGGSSVGNITIGGTTAGAGNVVSGSTSLFGIEVQADGPAVGTVVIQGNMIGTNALGTAAIGNTGGGIYAVQRSGGSIASLVIGGTTPGAGNVVSGNGFGGFGDGIFLDNVTNATIQGNAIGTNAAGTAAIANFAYGIRVGGPVLPENVLIGGPSAAARNILSGNGLGGIYVVFGQAAIQGNYIGVGADGVTAIGNAGPGVRVDSAVGAIGGTTAGQGNVIANNLGGVDVVIGNSTIRPTSNASILGNSIYDNSIQLGINLGFPQAVTPNDAGDADTGANDLQNFPVITSATIGGGNVALSGTLNSTPNTTFRVEFFGNPACSTSGFGEGKHFLGSRNVTTDGSGNVAFGPATFALPVGDTVFTATATDPAGNTSEFSACLASGAAASADVSVTKSAAASVAAGANVTYTIVVANGGPSDATGVSVADTLPAGTTFVSLAQPGGWTVTAPPPGGTGTVTLANASVPNGTSATFTLVVKVNAATPNGTNVMNTASATASTADPNPANNAATATTSVAAATSGADVSVTKSGSAAVSSGGTITYTIVVANAGPNAASNVVLTDALPANTTFVSLTPPSGWTVTTPSVGGSGTITASNASLASGASASFSVAVAVSGSAASGSTISNTASVSSSTADANAGNNSATESTSVTSGGQPTPEATPIPALSAWTLMLLVLSVVLLGVAAARRR
jgi:uncharacterized repeat protein (TIGR01451 family)